MKFLLDTCVVLRWRNSKSTSLSATAIAAIRNPNHQVIISAVVAWEICIKQQLGKLTIPGNFWSTLGNQNFRNIPITSVDALAIAELPFDRRHKDPFDRLLIAQAKRRDLTLVTTDNQILNRQQQYNVSLLRA